MAGITRIKIISTWHDWRTQLAQDLAPAANDIEIVEVSKEEAIARYDWSEGIDVILTSNTGARSTLQEKFLTYDREFTATFEEKKSNGDLGAWYYCTAQYYFVGYALKYWDWRNRVIINNPIMDFQEWRLLDFPAMRRADTSGAIQWKYDQNTMDGRRASFRYVNFDDIPDNCIIAKFNKIEQLKLFGWNRP